MLRRFEHSSRSAVAHNRKTLTSILEANRHTEFGAAHGFEQLARDSTGAAFRQSMPLRHYEDYEEAITRMERGETDVLVSDELLFFAVSSGTTGKPKLVPTTRKHHGFTFKYMGTVVQGVINREFHGAGSTDRGVDLMTFSGDQQYASGGTPIGGATAEAVRRMARIVPHLWNSPIDVYTMDHQPSASYLHAIYGLRNRHNQFVEAVFAPHLLEWLRGVVDRWEELVVDIERGTLSRDVQADSRLRRRVVTDNPADPERAQELRAAVREGFDGFVGRVWPHMTHAMTITSGSFATYIPALERYLGGIPIYSPSYGATESFIGVALWPDRPHQYVMVTDPAYFEFIPVERVRQDQPSTVDMAEVEVGERYELVVTNHSGLYRYRLGDVVSVVDRLGEAPVIEFSHRIGTQFDLVGEKTSETHVATAVREICTPSAGAVLSIKDYTTAEDVDASPARYVLYIETEGDGRAPIEVVAGVFDAALQRANPLTTGFRTNGLLGRPRVAIVENGTFNRLRDAITGVDLAPAANQVKIPRKLTDNSHRALLESAVVAMSD